MARPGEPCPKCGRGRMRTYSSRQAGEHSQLRYVECQACGHRDKAVVPAEQVWRRSTVEPTPAR